MLDRGKFIRNKFEYEELMNSFESFILDDFYKMKFQNICGVLNESDKIKFEKTLFRASRGNTYVNFHNLQQPIYDVEDGKETQNDRWPEPLIRQRQLVQ